MLVAIVAGLWIRFNSLRTTRDGTPAFVQDDATPLGEVASTHTGTIQTPKLGAVQIPPLSLERASADAIARTTAFADWLTIWRRTPATAQPDLVSAGRRLAAERRVGLAYLIKTDPERALALSIPVSLKSELPPEIDSLLETRVDTRGDFEVIAGCFGTVHQIDRFVAADGAHYRAYVFGRRVGQATKYAIPIHGIAIDGSLALDEAPLRLLDDGEKTVHSLPPSALVALVGREAKVLADTSQLSALRATLEGAESRRGPHLRSESEQP
ncbi:MAG: hypothetical protein KA788_06240, partial [Lacunisphaera sp.]|nr:hypothetical protein [Lacunisphaera sp.]